MLTCEQIQQDKEENSISKKEMRLIFESYSINSLERT
jgi:hypothetical protein